MKMKNFEKNVKNRQILNFEVP